MMAPPRIRPARARAAVALDAIVWAEMQVIASAVAMMRLMTHGRWRFPAAALIVTASIMLHGALAGAQAPEDLERSIDVAGVTRTYVQHVPAKLGQSIPVVLSFHGHFSYGRAQARLTKLDALSDERGFIVVYPDGLRGSWNDGRALDAGADDLAFVKALIADLASRYPIDQRRIFATGFSNGATFAQYLGCKLADRIAAIAPVSGYLPVEVSAGCRPSRPISVLEIGGTADPVEPYDGGEVRIGAIDRGAVRSAKDTIALWSAAATCASAPAEQKLEPREPDDGTSVTRTTYARCAGGAGIELDTINGGGHTWPGGPQYLPASIIGIASNQFDASRAIIDFLLAHPMPT